MTINGSHVLIAGDGTIIRGPDGLVGKNVHALNKTDYATPSPYSRTVAERVFTAQDATKAANQGQREALDALRMSIYDAKRDLGRLEAEAPEDRSIPLEEMQASLFSDLTANHGAMLGTLNGLVDRWTPPLAPLTAADLSVGTLDNLLERGNQVEYNLREQEVQAGRDALALPSDEQTKLTANFQTLTQTVPQSAYEKDEKLKGLAFVSSILHGDLRAGKEAVPIRVGDAGSRPYASANGLNLAANNGPSETAHELGHYLEGNADGFLDGAIAFYAQRTAGEDAKSLNALTDSTSFHPSETAKADKFADPYMGKVYTSNGHVDGTEIISMGLQLLHDNPARFIRDDPSSAHFIINLLSGKADDSAIKESDSASEDGVWRTINNAHVLIKNGEVVLGPASLVGKSASNLSAVHDLSQPTKYSEKVRAAVLRAAAERREEVESRINGLLDKASTIADCIDELKRARDSGERGIIYTTLEMVAERLPDIAQKYGINGKSSSLLARALLAKELDITSQGAYDLRQSITPAAREAMNLPKGERWKFEPDFNDPSKIADKTLVTYRPNPPLIKDAVAEGVKQVGKWFNPRSTDYVTVPSQVTVNLSDMRERANGSARGLNLGIIDGEETAAHEMGHFIEGNDRPLFDHAVAFLEKRTQGETLQPLSQATSNSAYGEDEITRADKFPDPYSGKDYRDGNGNIRATEITSMGLSHLYSDPEAFAKKDPEYFHFMVNLLKGDWRPGRVAK